MELITTIPAIKTYVKGIKQRGETICLVPTMGYLHKGHLDLMRMGKTLADHLVISIFVNPTQFGLGEDLAKYPRDIPRDLSLLETVKTDFVFIPSAGDMYPLVYNTWVDVEKVTERLEGASRPGHFRGVATVCNKLFNIVQPTKAYFGQKDAQQVVAIKKMVADLNMNLEIVAVPTMREPDGLAMSSRNTYLNPKERQAGVVLYKALTLAQKLYTSGEQDAEKIRQEMIKLIQKEPLASIDYVSIANAETLEEQDKITPPAVVSMAVRIGKTRLIDNVTL